MILKYINMKPIFRHTEYTFMDIIFNRACERDEVNHVEFEETEEEHALYEAFSELDPGFYILKCVQKMDAYRPDRIRHEQSVMFRLE